MLDPIERAEQITKLVCRNGLRLYYRFRADRWYGGIATADCIGCPLQCVFCWSKEARDNPLKLGDWYTPRDVVNRLVAIAKKKRYNQVRISGNEPTLGKEHLLEILHLIDSTRYAFILETSGILLGSDERYAQALAKFTRLHVRISFKGTNCKEFSCLTRATPQAFDLQLNGLKFCLDAGLQVHPAVMRSFSTNESFEQLLERFREIDPKLPGLVEDEYVFLYPMVMYELERAGIQPLVSFDPKRIPTKLV